ncbi:MAG TPA: SMI1/KNR4 family protein [Myxococcales bacterium]|nr:SMI1/KNR4 family protein [Myxococcales bacterium]
MKPELRAKLVDFSGVRGAGPEAIQAVESALGIDLPADYVDLIGTINGGEGLVGNQYLMLWRIDDLLSFNKEYEVEQYAPGLLLFGSNGGGEAYAFDLRSDSQQVVNVPFIGMDLKHIIVVAQTFLSFIDGLSAQTRKSGARRFLGKEIIEIKPIILGGSPTDLSNKVALDRRQHIEAVRYWNRIVRELAK